MSARFISKSVWRTLNAAAAKARRTSFVAVAYFGAGADRLIPMVPGSRLVVDASVAAVRAGQTHPETLMRMVKKGIFVYCHPQLHAKVFVIGSRAYIGSANVSSSSERRLTEAVVELTDRSVVKQAKGFVSSLCRDRLTPSQLEELQQNYRPPKIVNMAGKNSETNSRKTVHPSFHVSKLRSMEWPESEIQTERAGHAKARSKREHRTGWEIQAYRHTGRISVKPGDTVMQIINENGNGTYVAPPGKVLEIARSKKAKPNVSYVFLEVPSILRRPSLNYFAGKLEKVAQEKLKNSGPIRNQIAIEKIQHAWSEILRRRQRRK